MKKNEKGTKGYKLPLTICFVLFGIVMVVMGILLFKLNNKFDEIDTKLEFIKSIVSQPYNTIGSYLTWGEFNEEFPDIPINKPNDWTFDSGSSYLCTEFKAHALCNGDVRYVTIDFTIGSKTTYEQFLESLENGINSVSNGDYTKYIDNQETIYKYSDREISVKSKDDKVSVYVELGNTYIGNYDDIYFWN